MDLLEYSGGSSNNNIGASGGGAGELIQYSQSLPWGLPGTTLPIGQYIIEVGSGGGAGSITQASAGFNGEVTSITAANGVSIEANGGGGGGGGNFGADGLNGGSGGGKEGLSELKGGGLGNPGGIESGTSGAGGGGAIAAGMCFLFSRVFCNAQEENILHYVCPGESASSSSTCFEHIGGNGGPGIDLSAEFGLEFGVYGSFAGGGGGGEGYSSTCSDSVPGLGGTGGGGDGGGSNYPPVNSGAPNSGGGGGGAVSR